MLPGQTTVETSLSAEQSSLRKASDAYVEQAENEKWIMPSSTLLGLARVLVDGVTGDDTPDSYSDAIDASSAEPADVFQRILVDINRARSGLSAVTQEAQIFIAVSGHDKTSLRADVTSYERALITAQKSRRSFVDALSDVSERSTEGVSDVDAGLAEFDAAIDKARKTADDLADLYASAPSSSAAS